MNYLQEQKIKVLHWPSQSPDFNITEILLLYFKRAVNKKDLWIFSARKSGEKKSWRNNGNVATRDYKAVVSDIAGVWSSVLRSVIVHCRGWITSLSFENVQNQQIAPLVQRGDTFVWIDISFPQALVYLYCQYSLYVGLPFCHWCLCVLSALHISGFTPNSTAPPYCQSPPLFSVLRE